MRSAEKTGNGRLVLKVLHAVDENGLPISTFEYQSSSFSAANVQKWMSGFIYLSCRHPCSNASAYLFGLPNSILGCSQSKRTLTFKIGCREFNPLIDIGSLKNYFSVLRFAFRHRLDISTCYQSQSRYGFAQVQVVGCLLLALDDGYQLCYVVDNYHTPLNVDTHT